jgi:hypothetical protein
VRQNIATKETRIKIKVPIEEGNENERGEMSKREITREDDRKREWVMLRDLDETGQPNDTTLRNHRRG